MLFLVKGMICGTGGCVWIRGSGCSTDGVGSISMSWVVSVSWFVGVCVFSSVMGCVCGTPSSCS